MIEKLNIFIKNKFVKDSLFSSIAMVFRVLGVLLQSIFITKYFGGSVLGAFVQAYTIYIIISVFSNMGILRSLIKHFSEFKDDQEEQKSILTAGLLLTLPMFIVFAGTLYLVVYFNFFDFEPLMYSLLSILTFGVFFQAINYFFESSLIGLRDMKTYSVINIIRWFSRILIVFSFSFSKMDIHDLVKFIVGIEILISFIYFIYFFIKVNFTTQNLKKWFKLHFDFSNKSLMASFLNELTNRMDVLLIGAFLGNGAVGIYSFSASLGKGLELVSGVVKQNFEPIASNLWKNNKVKELKEQIYKIKKYNFIISIVITLFTALMFPVIVYFSDIKSSDYAIYYSVFFLFLISSFIASIYKWSFGLLDMSGHIKELLNIKILLFIIQLILVSLSSYYFNMIWVSVSFILFSLIKVYLFDKAIFKKIKISIIQFKSHN